MHSLNCREDAVFMMSKSRGRFDAHVTHSNGYTARGRDFAHNAEGSNQLVQYAGSKCANTDIAHKDSLHPSRFRDFSRTTASCPPALLSPAEGRSVSLHPYRPHLAAMFTSHDSAGDSQVSHAPNIPISYAQAQPSHLWSVRENRSSLPGFAESESDEDSLSRQLSNQSASLLSSSDNSNTSIHSQNGSLSMDEKISEITRALQITPLVPGREKGVEYGGSPAGASVDHFSNRHVYHRNTDRFRCEHSQTSGGTTARLICETETMADSGRKTHQVTTEKGAIVQSGSSWKCTTAVIVAFLAVLLTAFMCFNKLSLNANPTECSYAGFNTNALGDILRANILGQPAVDTIFIQSLQEFLSHGAATSDNHVFIFAGPSGTGKSFVGQLIERDVRYLEADNVNFHSFTATHDFQLGDFLTGKHPGVPSAQSTKDVIDSIVDRLLDAVENCSTNFVLIEDIDFCRKSTQHALVSSLVEFPRKQRLLRKYSKTIILLTTNFGSKALLDLTLSREGGASVEEAVKVLNERARTFVSGRNVAHWIQKLLQKPTIPTTVVPFLPLSVQHVTQCILSEIQRQQEGHIGLPDDKAEKVTGKVLDSLRWMQRKGNRVSISGCKLVAERVAQHLIPQTL